MWQQKWKDILFKGEEQTEILKILDLIINIEEYKKYMNEENKGQEFRLKKHEKRNYFIKEIKQNELITMKHKKVYKVLNYTEHCTCFSFYSYWMCFNFNLKEAP